MKLSVVQHFVSGQFHSLGRTIARYPGYFIIVPILFCGILITGLQRAKLYSDLDGLYTSDGSEAMRKRELLEQLFPTDTEKNFDFERTTRLDRAGFVYIIPKDGSSVLTQRIFAKVKRIDSFIRNITIKQDEMEYRFSDVCAKRRRRCFGNEYLNLEKRIPALENGTDSIDYPWYLNNRTFDYAIYAINVGGVTTDRSGRSVSAKAVRMAYYLNSKGKRQERLAEQWETKFLDVVKEMKVEGVDIYCYAPSSIVNEIHRITLQLVPLYAVAVFIMLCFSVATTMSADWVRSKPWCSVVGASCSGLAVLTSFGLLSYIGVDYIDINIAVPFLMLGIGMDDTFVILAAWRCTPRELSVEERLAKAYQEAAVSITVTSLTNFMSFLVGLTAPFPVVRLFCAAAASAVFFTYILQITLFGGFMALFGYAEERNLHSLTFLPIKQVPDSEGSKSFIQRFLCGTSQKEDTSQPNDEFFMMVYFRDSLGKALSNIYVKYLVIVVFLAYLVIGVWGCTRIKEGLEFQKLVPYDSYAVKAFDIANELFNEYRDRVQVVINTPLEYSDPKVQEQLEELVQKFEASPYISSNETLTEFWLRYFKMFLSDKRTALVLENYNISKKEDFMLCLKRLFLNFAAGKIVRDDLIFDENQTTIVASRFILQTVNLSGVQDDNKMMMDLRRIAKEAPFPVFVYHPLFVFYDQFQMVSQASFQSIGVAAAIMMVITFIFIPSVTTVISVAASIVSIEIGVIGYMTLWGVNVDTVSMINLIMCIGFSVDFAAHISHAYKHTAGRNAPNERMCNALYMVGLPIVQGSLSTVLAILVLVAAPAYIFLVFFKIIVLVITFAALHALLLLPVLFSLFGSINCNRSTESTSSSEEDIPKRAKKTSLVRKISSGSASANYSTLEKGGIRKFSTDDKVVEKSPLESMRPPLFRSSSVANPCYVNDETDFVKLPS